EPARAATNAATSRICCSLNCPENGGIPPPPFVTLSWTVAKPGRSWSRFGPTCPLACAAASVWHEPQPAEPNTLAPAETDAFAGIGELFAGEAEAVFWL